MSVGPAIGFLGFLKETTNPSLWTCEDTDPLSFRPTLGSVVSERRVRSRPHTQSSGSKAWIWKDKQPPEKMMTLQVDPIPSLVQPPILCHPQIPKPIPHGLLSLQPGPLSLIPQPTYLFTLFSRDPCPPAHGTEELESQFVEQGARGVVVLLIEEGQDGLFRGVVILFHVQGQVAEEGH